MKPKVNDPVLDWLLDPSSPGVRYLALRDLVGLHTNDPELIKARQEAHLRGPIATILEHMKPEGYWVKPGAGYSPKYYSTVWSLITLGQLGARVELDERIQKACDYLMQESWRDHGQFTHSGTPAGTFDCLQGNLCTALVALGCHDPRLDQAYDWMARTQTGEGMASQADKDAERRYYAYKCGPNFACGANSKMPCAWGAVKVMMAFAALPSARRTPLIKRAIQQGVDFLFSVDPATADYPSSSGIPNTSWWKFGFPVFYITDILQIAEALVGLGFGNDPRLENTLALIHQKQDDQGRWALEYEYKGKTWGNYGKKRKPSPWVTLRVLRVLQKVSMV